MNSAVIAFGSNIDPDENTRKAREMLERRYGIVRESPFVETKPIGDPEQPDFLNGVVLIETEESREDVWRCLKEIEDALGRRRGGHRFGPRTMDLDLVVWNGAVVHRDVRERDFLRSSVRFVLPDLPLEEPGA